MLRSEAERLTQQIIRSWPNDPWPQGLIDQWVYDLAKLDHGTAGTAFARARTQHPQTPPTWTEFHAIYAGLRTKQTQPYERCQRCDGTGFTETRLVQHSGHWYPYAGTCDCGAGIRRRDASQRHGRPGIDIEGGLTHDDWAKLVR